MNILNIEVGGSSLLIEEGTYDAVLMAIIQNGVQTREFQGKQNKPANMIKLLFEIPGVKNSEGKSAVVGKEMPAIMSDRSNCFKYFKNMGVFKEPTTAELNRVFSSEESVKALLGTAVSAKIGHFEKTDGSKGHYLESVAKLDERLPQPKGEEETYIFTFSNPDINLFKNKLTSYGRERIMGALNSKDLPKEFHEFYATEQEERKKNDNTKSKSTGSVDAKKVI